MSGGNVPYHLRPNKFVERQLGIELIERLGRWRNLTHYVYVSMGGAFLEDLRQVHARCGMSKLYSIEGDSLIYDRQIFNKPLGVINCLRQTSEEFVKHFGAWSASFEKASFFVWLDYTTPRERLSQLKELHSLLSMLGANDVVKITMNANLDSLGIATHGRQVNEYQPEMLEHVRKQLGDYFPTDRAINAAQMNSSGFAKILSCAIGMAAIKGVEGTHELRAVPLSIFRYSDGHHPMITVTIILLDHAAEAKFKKSRLAKWEYRATDWNQVKDIEVPELSVKERIFIDEYLFIKSDDEIHATLPFRFHKNADLSCAILKNYIAHYNRYPHFMRVTL